MEASGELSFFHTLLPFVSIVFMIAVGVVLLNQQFRKNLHKKQLEQEEMKSLHQQELLRTTIEVQENERRRIAQDLHDELGAVLSISKMHLIQLQKQSGEQLGNSLAQVRELTENALTTTRRISHELMPVQLEALGLEKALESLAHRLSETGDLTIDLKIIHDLQALPWPVSLALYRISTELINNTIKHAEATAIDIFISHEPQKLVYKYSDNGKGLSQNQGKGLGLKNLEGRLHALKASLDFGNQSQGGFYAAIEIPLQ